MDNAYISLKTNEIITSKTPDYINCDEKISKVILLLNNKGYITKYSCSGHIDNLLYYEETLPVSEKNFLDENKGLEIIRETENEIIYRGIAWLGCNMYISFDKNYNFDVLPNGFVFEDNHIIRKYFQLQDEFGNKYTLKELKEIQNNSILELLEWVKSLKNICEKERGKNI